MMSNKAVMFAEIHVDRPEYTDVAAEFKQLDAAWQAAAGAADCRQVIHDWDALERRLATWVNLVDLRFNQDTSNTGYKQAREYSDELKPRLTDLSVRMKRKLIDSPYRGELEATFGPQAFAIWEADVLAFDPKIEADLVKESKLEAEFTDLLASAKLQFRGNAYNFAGLAKFHVDSDRQVRYESNAVKWQWFADNVQQLDRIYDEQVRLRTNMAKKLGYENFIGLAYKRMKRVDYNQADVERFRAAVREDVVPLTIELRRTQAESLGIDRVMFWDEGVFDPRGNPKPQGDHDWMIERAIEMFDEMGGGLGEFFRLMDDCNLMDLKNRDSKAGGGFCTDFPSFGLPYIFANFNGTKGDVEVFTHEIGHAFQSYCSREQPLADYLFPTYESCEIHSMGLEFLTWPQMEKFFGDSAERFRQIHLLQSLLFLPYGVAVDHFQHLVYSNPDATPLQRHEMWREMEAAYLPTRDCGDLPHVPAGGQWQFQRHIYLSPFYYIDYTLALTCALQFWVRSRVDMKEAMQTYVALCKRGGAAPFRQLAESAGLVSPFEEGCLREVVGQARQFLGVAG
ncbi:MAG TPA: M3 family oligoendopeptidase [Pirellulaceae bacterium]|nr:M3 family oligoendopeptidase [Pirellulaceae bacterium]